MVTMPQRKLRCCYSNTACSADLSPMIWSHALDRTLLQAGAHARFYFGGAGSQGRDKGWVQEQVATPAAGIRVVTPTPFLCFQMQNPALRSNFHQNIYSLMAAKSSGFSSKSAAELGLIASCGRGSSAPAWNYACCSTQKSDSGPPRGLSSHIGPKQSCQVIEIQIFKIHN